MDNLAKRPTDIYRARIREGVAGSFGAAGAITVGSAFVNGIMTGGASWLPSIIVVPLGGFGYANNERAITSYGKKTVDKYKELVKNGEEYIDIYKINKLYKKAKEGGSK